MRFSLGCWIFAAVPLTSALASGNASWGDSVAASAAAGVALGGGVRRMPRLTGDEAQLRVTGLHSPGTSELAVLQRSPRLARPPGLRPELRPPQQPSKTKAAAALFFDALLTLLLVFAGVMAGATLKEELPYLRSPPGESPEELQAAAAAMQEAFEKALNEMREALASNKAAAASAAQAARTAQTELTRAENALEKERREFTERFARAEAEKRLSPMLDDRFRALVKELRARVVGEPADPNKTIQDLVWDIANAAFQAREETALERWKATTLADTINVPHKDAAEVLEALRQATRHAEERRSEFEALLRDLAAQKEGDLVSAADPGMQEDASVMAQLREALSTEQNLRKAAEEKLRAKESEVKSATSKLEDEIQKKTAEVERYKDLHAEATRKIQEMLDEEASRIKSSAAEGTMTPVEEELSRVKVELVQEKKNALELKTSLENAERDVANLQELLKTAENRVKELEELRTRHERKPSSSSELDLSYSREGFRDSFLGEIGEEGHAVDVFEGGMGTLPDGTKPPGTPGKKKKGGLFGFSSSKKEHATETVEEGKVAGGEGQEGGAGAGHEGPEEKKKKKGGLFGFSSSKKGQATETVEEGKVAGGEGQEGGAGAGHEGADGKSSEGGKKKKKKGVLERSISKREKSIDVADSRSAEGAEAAAGAAAEEGSGSLRKKKKGSRVSIFELPFTKEKGDSHGGEASEESTPSASSAAAAVEGGEEGLAAGGPGATSPERGADAGSASPDEASSSPAAGQEGAAETHPAVPSEKGDGASADASAEGACQETVGEAAESAAPDGKEGGKKKKEKGGLRSKMSFRKKQKSHEESRDPSPPRGSEEQPREPPESAS